MIIGIGVDIVSVQRLTISLDKIAARVFTPEELAAAADSAHRMEHLAGRWAAKEALAKALGCGFGEKCSWQDINISNDPSGKPQMFLTGRTLQSFKNMAGKSIHLSISHEKEYATAFVILEG
jgi:holo-[acyl-carrier protein] synthase